MLLNEVLFLINLVPNAVTVDDATEVCECWEKVRGWAGTQEIDSQRGFEMGAF